MSSGGLCLTLAAVSSVKREGGSRRTWEEEETAVVQVSDYSGGSDRDDKRVNSDLLKVGLPGFANDLNVGVRRVLGAGGKKVTKVLGLNSWKDRIRWRR